MYIGRIVAAGMTHDGKSVAMYRVSSRSFPNREARIGGETVSIMPQKGFEDDLSKNPYIAYNCLRIAGNCAVACNGSHTDPISEKIASGMSVRDAMALSLLAMDYEKDSYCTPRIAAAVDRTSNRAYLGTVKKDGLIVREFELKPGMVYYVATYEKDIPCAHNSDSAFKADDAYAACAYILRGGAFAEFEKPVTAAAAIASDKGFELAVSLA